MWLILPDLRKSKFVSAKNKQAIRTKKQADKQVKESEKAEKAAERAKKSEKRRQNPKHAGGDGSAQMFKSAATVEDSDDDMIDEDRPVSRGEVADEDMVDRDQPVSISQLAADPHEPLENDVERQLGDKSNTRLEDRTKDKSATEALETPILAPGVQPHVVPTAATRTPLPHPSASPIPSGMFCFPFPPR